MAFSDDVRTELAGIFPAARCCRLAELSAMYDLDGLLLGNDRGYMDFYNSSPLVARKVLLLLRGLYPHIPTQVLTMRTKSRRTQICTVRVLTLAAANEVYQDIKDQMMVESGDYLRKRCCRRAYIRGAFLSHGSITNPEKTYHLEISTDQTQTAMKILSTLNSFNLEAGMTERKGNHVVYLKDGGQIVNFLNLVGAHQALLYYENVRVLKDMRNQVNRLVNCETANVDKTVQAAMSQISDIQTIAAYEGLENLPPKLQQIANLRRDNPYASLRELGELAVPKMSKSGVNYRLRQLKKMAEQIRNLHT